MFFPFSPTFLFPGPYLVVPMAFDTSTLSSFGGISAQSFGQNLAWPYWMRDQMLAFDPALQADLAWPEIVASWF